LLQEAQKTTTGPACFRERKNKVRRRRRREEEEEW